MSTWKKVLIAVGLLLLVGVLFWKTIYTTVLYVSVEKIILSPQGVTSFVPAPRALMPATNITAIEQRPFGSLSIPIIFTPTEVRDQPEALAILDENKSIIIFDALEIRDEFMNSATQGASNYPAIEDPSCKLLTSLFPRVCTSNYEFQKAVFSVNSDQVTIFSSKAEKLAYGILGLMKLVTVTDSLRESYSFTTENIRGFTFERLDTDGSLVILGTVFDQEDQQYDIVFTGLTQGEADYMLANIKTP